MHRFSDDVVTAVLAHMNDDHADDNLIIARAYGPREATAATMTGLDGNGGDWVATVGDESVPVRADWLSPVEDRPAIRRAVVMLYRDACARLGISPREEH